MDWNIGWFYKRGHDDRAWMGSVSWDGKKADGTLSEFLRYQKDSVLQKYEKALKQTGEETQWENVQNHTYR